MFCIINLSVIKPYGFLCLLLAFAAVSFAQVEDKLLLNRINTLQGLSSNEVKCIYQDSRGFIWIGTFDGLNRYDGRNIKVYRRNISDSNSLINNWINSVVEDKNGDLWIGTSSGVSRLNILNGRFTNYYPAQLFPGQKSLAGEQMVFKDHNNKIWVCSGGLSYYEENTGRFITQPFIPPTPVHHYNLNQLVTSITVDKEDNFWMGTFDGFYKYDILEKRYIRYNDDPSEEAYIKHGDLLGNANILNDHQMLISSWSDKIFILNTDSNIFKLRYFIPVPGKFDIRVFKVQWNGENEYWAAHNSGIVRFDENLKKIEEWQSVSIPEKIENALSGSVSTIYQSKEGIIFIGTTNGLIIINPYLQVFKTYYFPGLQSTFGTNAGSIASLAFGKNKIFAGALYSNALYVIDDKWRLSQTIKTFGTLSPTEATANTYDMVKDAGGLIWMATFQGLIKLDPKTMAFKIYLPDKNDALFYRHKRFFFIKQEDDSTLWLANYKQDLVRFDKKKETFKIFHPFGIQKSIWGLLASNNKIWFTSGNILGKYDPVKDTVNLLTNNRSADVSYENIIPGKDNELWLSSGNGIWRFNIKTNEWHNWNTADGLCNDYVNNILFDKKGHLWITTYNGISAFDTTQKIFYNFNSQNGLPVDEWGGAIAANDSGIIFLGNSGLITFFDPSKVIGRSDNYPAYITGCQVNGSDYSLPSHSAANKNISLGYDQNNLNFQFTVVNLLQPFQTSYYYKLQGFDKEWHLSSTGIINYTNLDPGGYILMVSSNPANLKANNNEVLYITIHHPFWTTWWFITGIIGLTLGSFTYAIRSRISHIKNEANRKATISQQVADLRMKALRSQMNPHFLFNSLNAIQECCITGQIDTATQYLARFSKLVRFILENSGKQWVSLHDEIEMLKLYLDVESLRFTSSFNYHIENNISLDEGLLKIPPMLVQPFVENAIWHGLMQKNGDRHVWVRFYNNEEKLFIEIEDNGVGRNGSKKSDHNSMGMGIVNERMKIIEEIQKSSASMEVIDKKDARGNPSGTLVKLKLPLL